MCPKFHQACIAIDGNRNRRTHGQTNTRTHGHTDTRTDGLGLFDSVRDIC